MRPVCAVLLGVAVAALVLWWAAPAAAQLEMPLPAQPGSQQSMGADAPEPSGALQNDSPRDAVFGFLEAVRDIREGDKAGWARAVAKLDLSDVSAAPGSHESHELVRQLLAVLDRIRWFAPEDFPGPGELDPTESEYVVFPRPLNFADEQVRMRLGTRDVQVVLERGLDGRWRFSDQTVANVPAYYELVKDLPPQVNNEELIVAAEPFIRQYVPDSLKYKQVLGIEYWQWIGLALVILIGLIVDQVVRFSTRPFLQSFIVRYGIQLEERVQNKPSMPFGLTAAGLTWLILLHFLGIPGDAKLILLAAARLFTILAGTWATWRLIDFLGDVLLKKAEKTDTKFDDVLVPLLRKTLKIFVVVFGLIYAAQSLHINIIPLITGLGIGGLAFAFAAKDTIENFFGSVAVVLDRPFEVGDWVVIDGTEGIIEELGFRSTRIRTFYNSLVTVPNATLVRAVVDNYGRRKYRRWKTMVGVQYDTTPDQLLAFTEGIRELVRCHPYTRKDYFQVYVNEFADSSLNILIYVFFEVPDWSTELRERERLFIDMVRLADKLGVSFAFPTQTVHLYKEEHAEHAVQHDVPQKLTERRAKVTGIRAAQELIGNQPWQDEKPGAVEFKFGPSSIEPELDADGNPIETQIEDRTAGG